MKRTLVILMCIATSALAQIGIGRSWTGIHVPSAETMDQGLMFVSGSFSMINDGNPFSIDGYYTNGSGEKVQLDENIPSNDETLFISFSVLDNLEVNFSLPFHYDGDVKGTNLKGFGLGDIQFGAKSSFNAYENLVFGGSTEITIPTGSAQKGFRPRHRWYINNKNEAYAYTANNVAIGLHAHASLIFSFMNLSMHFGGIKVFDSSENISLWGIGLTMFPKKILAPIFEISGETPLGSSDIRKKYITSPFVFTPGLRLKLPKNFQITVSGDVGLNYFIGRTQEHSKNITLKTGKKKLDYDVPGSPNVTVSAVLSKRIDFRWSDGDGDGVPDRDDMCPNTNHGLTVNARGCPVDEDEDGVLDIMDLCPGTLLGLDVDFNGCPIDADKDGVFDYLDKCLGTPEGFAVDAKGCVLDSDGDGVDDNNDNCPNTINTDEVDGNGCPLDEDHDGISNKMDKCPNSPEGVTIDKFGCPLDFDHDGVPNEFDQCPNSGEGETVDEAGCPLDTDHDGVPDARDNCPETISGVHVDEFGCRVDQDGDGVFDEDDKCPNTPKGAPIDSLGCPLDSDGDGIADWYDQCPNSFKNVVVDQKGCPMNDRLNFNDIAKRIRFKDKDTTFYNSSYTALNDVVANMRQYPIAMEIECAAPKQSLAEERAKKIYDYLEYKGISMERLKYKGYEGKLPKAISERSNETSGVRLTPYTLEK